MQRFKQPTTFEEFMETLVSRAHAHTHTHTHSHSLTYSPTHNRYIEGVVQRFKQPTTFEEFMETLVSRPPDTNTNTSITAATAANTPAVPTASR